MQNMLSGIILGLLSALGSTSILASSADIANRIHNRITGVSPSPDVLSSMTTLVDQGDLAGAANIAMQNHLFYTDTLKKLFAPFSNESLSVTTQDEDRTIIQFNDYVATLIGMVRDNKPFNTVFSHNYLYVGDAAQVENLPAYAPDNNDHYLELERQKANLMEVLVEAPQVENIPAIAGREAELGTDGQPLVPAGVLTTRGFASSFYNAGTNRAPFRFMLLNFMCNDIDAFHDLTIPTVRIRRDVSRGKVFTEECQGCHAGMDGFTGSFAYLDWDDENGVMLYTRDSANTQSLADSVRDKFNQQPVYLSGHTTVDDSWVNLWNQGVNNTKIGWPEPATVAHQGNGPRSFGELFGNTNLFAQCMAEHSFRLFCLRDALNKSDQDQIMTLTDGFKSGGYNFKNLIANTVAACPGK